MGMTLRLTDEESDQLAELAAAEGRSHQEVVRSALAERWAARRHQEQELQDVVQRVLPRYRGLLDKLGPA